MPLIAIEGIDGCGKTSVIEGLREALKDIAPLCISDFAFPETAHLKRLAVAETSVPAQIHLFMAARILMHRYYVGPWLDTDGLVIYDRYLDTTLAYQGQACAAARDFIHTQHTLSDLPRPALTLVLDIPIATMRARMQASGRSLDRIEQLPDRYFETARSIFLKQASYSKRHVVIDAEQPLPRVVEQCLAAIRTRGLHAPTIDRKPVTEENPQC